MVSIQVEATPMIGFESASSSKPMPFSCARAAARAGPSTSWRELWRGSRAAMGGREAYPGRVAGGRGSGLGVVPEHVVHPGLLGGWLVSKPPVPRRTPDEVAR